MKKHFLISCLTFLGFISDSSAQQTNHELKLWYTRPASIWEEALPLGNGKTGAMVFGGITKERFQLNDNTLWSGYPDPGNNSNGPTILPQVRAQVFAGNYDSATSLWKKMQGPYSARYLPLADLWLENTLPDSVTTDYRRELDLNTAIATVEYTIQGVRYRRESFISYPSRLMIVRITADKKRTLNFTASLTSKLHFKVKAVSNNELVLTGKAPKYVANREADPQQIVYDPQNGEGMNFEVRARIQSNGIVKRNGESLEVNNADTVTIYLSGATSFNGFNRSPGLEGKNPSAETKSILDQVKKNSYLQLRSTHIKDYQNLFHRVRLNLGENPSAQLQSTDLRLRNFNKQNDPGLAVLYYQYGRYLLIAASRPGSRPANLQGIWNDHVQPPWGSNYTTNINTEMNYWLAENTNLSECHQPLFNFIKELSVNGAKTAKVNYDIQRGWVAHHNSDLWAKTSPPGGWDKDPRAMPRWSAWPMAGVWLSTHLWEHYLFTGDKKFLKEEAYPLMKGAAQFLLQWLIKDVSGNYLVTNPSTSPENTVKIKGKEYQLSIASTMDMSLARELFAALIKTIDVLNMDPEFRKQLVTANELLFPYQIGQYGQLQEWYQDWDDPNDKHRHLSHLFGLYPGSQISLSASPELAAAAKQSLIHRGDVSTGWSMAWKINWWARLNDGEHAYKILSSAFTYIDPREKRETMGGGGTYPNLFDAHPPFQIDGNFGATAGITEMLLQSHEGFLQLLPALPEVWNKGSVEGIKGRGNFTVSMNWSEGKLDQARIISNIGGTCQVKSAQPLKLKESTQVSKKSYNSVFPAYGKPVYINHAKTGLQPVNNQHLFTIEFATEKGKTYVLVPAGE